MGMGVSFGAADSTSDRTNEQVNQVKLAATLRR
ncbi:hypothetical protein ACNKHK_11580 [Shigella flexneri]